MLTIRLHFRADDPLAEVGKILAKALLESARPVQYFDSFGTPRPGQPTWSVLRVGRKKILGPAGDSTSTWYLRERATNSVLADVAVFLDPSLFDFVDPKSGLREGASLFHPGRTPPPGLSSGDEAIKPVPLFLPDQTGRVRSQVVAAYLALALGLLSEEEIAQRFEAPAPGEQLEDFRRALAEAAAAGRAD
ncbi:MAG: hypothetical protein M1553_04010 [Firmicutes bacterium]|nr:hypothetical protein [Bacillota bacterium]